MPSILRNHYVLAVPEAQASADYFVRVLGFAAVPVSDPGWRFVQKDGCMIMLGSCPDAIAPHDLGDHSYFGYLVVDNVDGYYQELKQRGAQFISQPADKPWGMREFGVRTPDGHRIMIGQEIRG
jgi:catechol 2,3-dioxygenase-like lactoylglutathione lyase family enzyme